MAVTSIWSVKGQLGKVVAYLENPEKTMNPRSTDGDADKDKEKDIDTDIEKEPPKGRRSAKSGNSAAGGKSRSADKKIINDGHSYDLDKLMEYAMTHTPAFPSDRRGG